MTNPEPTRKMHMRKITKLDYKLLAGSLEVGALISEHHETKHPGSKKRRRRKKKR